MWAVWQAHPAATALQQLVSAVSHNALAAALPGQAAANTQAQTYGVCTVPLAVCHMAIAKEHCNLMSCFTKLIRVRAFGERCSHCCGGRLSLLRHAMMGNIISW